jgi:ribosome-binding protein aMBF1 (putative translation factor)
VPFATNLKYIKSIVGFSNYQLAKELECSQSSVKNWIDGGNIPHKKTRQKIAEHFGITLAELDGDKLPVLPPESAKKAPAAKGEDEAKLAQFVDGFMRLTPQQKDTVLALIKGFLQD